MQHAVSTATSTVDYPGKPGKYQKLYLPVRAAKYGDTADECGEALFLCGKSLLELARLVDGLFTILDSWNDVCFGLVLTHLLISFLLQLASNLAPSFGCVDAILCCWLLVRMENSVLGNALEGVPEESEGEEQPNDSKIESADNLDGKYQMLSVLVFLKRKPKSEFVFY